MRTIFSILAATILAPAIWAQSQLPIMPMPASVQQGTGQLLIDRTFSVAVTGFHDASLDRGIKRFQTQLSAQTGIPPRPKTGTAPSLQIHADHAREKIQKLGEDESYALTIAPSGASLTAPTPLGILHGLQTFLQLVQPTADGFAAPAVTIKDQPRFPWRGTLIDVSRHFLPLDVLKRNLDAMEAVKLNVLHWHLSDDQGFRVESKKFPKLHEMGSEGLYYTQAEIREFINYAYDRGIRVIPEFDTPGHSKSWFVAYPQLASGPGPFTFETDSIDSVTDPTQESTYKFLDKFVEEMASLFPDAYFHIGGDEVNGKYWDANPKIQAFMHAQGLKDNQALQAYFNQRLLKIVTRHHKNMIGWDEILHPDLPKTIVIQSWRGQESLATAAKQGYSGLLSFGYYLDLMWPAAQHYAVDPMSGAAATLSPEEKTRILGGESCMWAEWLTPENADSHIWPRNAVVAERLWSPQEMTDSASMYERVNEVSLHLETLGLTHRSARMHMLHRMAGTEDITALRTLADVIEPVKGYNRWDDAKGPIDFHSPLNRIIDAVYPESDVARHFGDLVKTYTQSSFTDKAAEVQIRAFLVTWSENDAKLRPVIEKSFLLQEVAPISEDLSALSSAALQALDYVDRSETSPDQWRSQQSALIERAKSPRSALLLPVAAPLQQLIDASGNRASR
jgi:hexosaminidase